MIGRDPAFDLAFRLALQWMIERGYMATRLAAWGPERL